jgi:hypothetical protein
MPVKDPEVFNGAVKFFEGLDLDPIGLFLDGHYKNMKGIDGKS